MDPKLAYSLYERSVQYLRTTVEPAVFEMEGIAPPAVEIAVVVEETAIDARVALRVRRYDEDTLRVIDHMKAIGALPEDVEVMEVGRLIGFGATDLVSPLQPGVSCANVDGRPGTLGCFVARNGTLHMLSVNHVLALENNALPNSEILQPRAGIATFRAIGKLVDHEPLQASGNLIDGAIATVEVADLNHAVFDVGKHITSFRTADLLTGHKVFKFGQASGATEGRVKAPKSGNVTLHMDFGAYTFDEQIEVEPEDGTPFALPGDSGALVYDENDEAVGLVVGGNGVNVTYLSPIRRILTRFGATLA